MFPHSLSTSALTKRVMNSVSAGTTSTSSTGVDMLGYTGVRFIASLGALTATQVTAAQAQESTDDGSTDPYANVGAATAAMADTDSNKMLIVEVFRPKKRYVRLNVQRGVASAAIDGVVAELYRSQQEAVAADATVSAQILQVNV